MGQPEWASRFSDIAPVTAGYAPGLGAPGKKCGCCAGIACSLCRLRSTAYASTKGRAVTETAQAAVSGTDRAV